MEPEVNTNKSAFIR